MRGIDAYDNGRLLFVGLFVSVDRNCASILQKNLFILDNTLRRALLTIRSYGLKLTGWNILVLHPDAVYTLEQFLQAQASRRQQLAADLKKVWLAVITEVRREESKKRQRFSRLSAETQRNKLLRPLLFPPEHFSMHTEPASRKFTPLLSFFFLPLSLPLSLRLYSRT